MKNEILMIYEISMKKFLKNFSKCLKLPKFQDFLTRENKTF